MIELCPFETIKKFKTGFSIRCPRGTQVSWCSKEHKDEIIQVDLRNKRRHTCQDCKQKILEWANK